jgi:nicotinic acid mononucleotide adenylyltransferase
VTADIAERLAALDEATEHRVLRFHDGPPFEGRVAVLPSAFNPPTLAHLALLALGAEEGGAQAALFTTRNVDKGLHGAMPAQRVEMLLAARQVQPFAVLATNAARIVDQAAALRGCWPGCRFDFVMGHDTLIRLFDAKYYEDMAGDLRRFFAAHRVIATNRGAAGVDIVEAFLREPHVAPFAGGVEPRALHEYPASLSSTAAREAAAAGLARLVPGPVAEYVRAHRLYRDGG